MKCKVWDKEEVFFTLKEGVVNDDVILFASTTDGKQVVGGNILRILNDGSISLCSDVAESIGLKLDEDACIVINEERM